MAKFEKTIQKAIVISDKILKGLLHSVKALKVVPLVANIVKAVLALVLNIYSRISMPGSFVNSVTAGTFAWLPKEMITNLAQIAETNSLWVSFHIRYYFFDFSHITIVSLSISLSRGDADFFG